MQNKGLAQSQASKTSPSVRKQSGTRASAEWPQPISPKGEQPISSPSGRTKTPAPWRKDGWWGTISYVKYSPALLANWTLFGIRDDSVPKPPGNVKSSPTLGPRCSFRGVQDTRQCWEHTSLRGCRPPTCCAEAECSARGFLVSFYTSFCF